MKRDIDFSKWFNTKARVVTMGTELELILFNMNSKTLVNDENLIMRVLDKLPKQIYKDYYNYQLEIRTKPYKNISKVISETQELYKLSSKEFLKEDVMVIPASLLVKANQNQTACGLHIHVAYDDIKDNHLDKYYNRAMGMYPFILSIADQSKNSETDMIHGTERMEKSPHIGLPFLRDKDFIHAGGNNNERYKDIALTPPNVANGNRNKMVKPFTVEIRLFDTPSLFSYYKFILESMYNLARYVKDDNPMVNLLTNSFDRTTDVLRITRDLVLNQRYGFNKIFHMASSNVCSDLADYFGYEFLEETQFEFREKNKLSADINGFISMATKGGWL